VIKYLVSYILGRTILAIVPWIWPVSRGNAKGSFGKIEFYGPKAFVEECLKAMNEDLSKYDEILKHHFLNGKISLCFYYEEKRYFMYPSVGLYTIPEKISHYKAQGICQFVVFRYFQSLETGMGLSAALRDNSNRHKKLMLKAKKQMVRWLDKCNYPAGWIDCYK
jgi:hypothetical protein